MLRALRKGKFWIKTKKRRKSICPHCCSCSSRIEPSAPPLPPSWIDFQPPQMPTPPIVSSTSQTPIQEASSETSPLCAPPPVTSSYQQYMDSNPVYGVPLSAANSTDQTAGSFGCAIGMGSCLLRVFCPCFLVRRIA
ncbi:hypothetical protein AMTRI_Chr12g240960 [Amborella trichopoda]|uniref:Uncharacterized protein n=1 Tax=Amborella trichopoda TaxID=13333 RepID=W1PH37_AMBTC|nr:hypothetical protein AMTR_s00019p00205020 [Amborella trichopoda]